MKKYILSIDQGTTSSRAVLIDKQGKIVNVAQREFPLIYPCSGWVEADATTILVSVINVIDEVLLKENLTFDNIDSIGITNQRETTVIWSKKTGMPVCNAIIWQSRQSAEICDKLEEHKGWIHQKTGLLINPYFSASKIRFMLDHIENGQQRAEQGEFLFGTIDCWLIYKLTNGKVHATDVSNASRTLLFNINTIQWDDELLKLFNVPKCMLPSVFPSSYNFGKATYFKCDVNICGVAGDQQAALFGQTCFDKGECKNTYGTGCFMLMNTGDKPVFSKLGLLSTIAWQIKDEVTYALEGSVFMGGALIQWVRDGLELIEDSKQSYNLALEACKQSNVYVVPAFVGLGTPYWDDDARGAIFGLTRQCGKRELIKACLQGIAYQCKDVFEVMKKETGNKISSLQVDGGATANDYLVQFQSDILKSKIKLPHLLETTALGAAYLAGLESGFFKSFEDLRKIHTYKKIYKPSMPAKEVKRLYSGWKKAVKATRVFK